MSKLPLPAGGSRLDLRRVLVVISDGDDTLSRRARSEALDMAQRAGIVIYTISTSTEWIVSDNKSRAAQTAHRKYMKTAGDKVLEVFANDSGGRAFFPYLIDDLASVLRRHWRRAAQPVFAGLRPRGPRAGRQVPQDPNRNHSQGHAGARAQRLLRRPARRKRAGHHLRPARQQLEQQH